MPERLNPFKAIVVRAGVTREAAGTGLSSKEKASLNNFVDGIIEGRLQKLSEQGGIFQDHKLLVTGEECLKELEEGGFLSMGYLRQGPLRGLWIGVASSIVLARETGIEPRIIQSYGKFLASIVHVALAESTNGILVGIPGRRGEGRRQIHSALVKDKSVLGLHPEGFSDYSGTLRRVSEGSGGLMEWAARHGMPTVTVSAWPENQTDLCLNFKVQRSEDILGVANSAGERANADMAVGDHIMTQIARNTPERFRGYYAAAVSAMADDLPYLGR